MTSSDTTTYITERLHALPADPTLAVIFPGQGSQKVGMATDVVASSAIARQVFKQADRILESDLSGLCFYGPEDALTRTANAQPAIMTASLAMLAAALESSALDRRPAFVAGHSLGEYTALIAAGSLTLENALLLVRERGRLMERAGEEQEGTMAAIVGLSEEDAVDICRLSGAEVCNYNSPSQIVVGGTTASVDRACQIAKERGGRGLVLNVSGAFHSSLMASAAQEFAQALDSVPANDPAIPVVSNVTATLLDSASGVIADLSQQITKPVLWRQSLTFMVGQGVHTLIEAGPGHALTAILKRSYPEVTAISIDGVAAMTSTSNV